MLELVRSGTKVLCLAGEPHLGKSSFLREELPSLASDSDLLFAPPGADGAREARSFAASEPVHGDFKVLVVEDALRLSDSAQDAYLKLLEEPPSSLRIVLTAEDPWAMRPAIRSRLRKTVRWGVLSGDEMSSFAETVEPVDPALITMVHGRPGLYNRAHGKKYYADLVAAVRSVVGGSLHSFMDPVPEAVDRLAGDVDERSVVSHLCRFAAIASGGSRERVRCVLKFCSTLSVPSVNAGVHWLRMASDLLAL